MEVIKLEKEKAINCKVAVINPDGFVNYLGSIHEIEFHGEYLMDYIKEKYPMEEEFEDLDMGSHHDLFAYHLGNFGDAVYYNAEHYGVIYLPKDVTDAQIEAICALNLGNQPVELDFNPKYYSFPCYETIGMGEGYTLDEAMNEYKSRFNSAHMHK